MNLNDRLIVIINLALLGLLVFVFALSKLYHWLSTTSNPLPQKEEHLARKAIDHCTHLVALHNELDTLHNRICDACRTDFIPGAASSSFGDRITSNSIHIPLWRRLFGGRPAQPQTHPGSRLTDLRNTETSTRRLGASIESTLVSPPSIPPQNFAGVDNIANSPESEPDQANWSVVHNHEVGQTLDIHLAHTLKMKSVVNCVKFSREGEYLAVGLHTGETYIYDMRTFSYRILTIMEYPPQEQPAIFAMQFSPDDKYIATGQSGGQIRVWDLAETRVLVTLKGHTSTVFSVDFSPSGRFLLSGSWDGSVRIWCMRDGSSKKLLDAGMSGVVSAAISPNGRYVGGADKRDIIRIWDFRSRQLLQRWRVNGDRFQSFVVFTPDGERLLSGGEDRTMKSWDISSLMDSQSGSRRGNLVNGILDEPEACSIFQGHTGAILSVAIFPGGRWVLSASIDSTARIWDVRTGAWQCTLRGHRDVAMAADASPDGSHLATGSYDRSVRVWRYEQVLGAESGAGDSADRRTDPDGEDEAVAMVAMIRGLQSLCGVVSN